jgi:hypothetical protein
MKGWGRNGTHWSDPNRQPFHGKIIVKIVKAVRIKIYLYD